MPIENKQVYQRDGLRKRTMVWDDSEPDKFATHTELDCTGLVDQIAEERKDLRPRSLNKTVARVPMTVYEQSVHEQWDDADWKRWLNDPANRAFRVWEGRV